jgi:hypothetical protein
MKFLRFPFIVAALVAFHLTGASAHACSGFWEDRVNGARSVISNTDGAVGSYVRTVDGFAFNSGRYAEIVADEQRAILSCDTLKCAKEKARASLDHALEAKDTFGLHWRDALRAQGASIQDQMRQQWTPVDRCLNLMVGGR